VLSEVRRSIPRGGTALAVAGPEQPPLLLLVPYRVRKLAELLPAGGGLVKAESHLMPTCSPFSQVNVRDMEWISYAADTHRFA
jgi:hypothetical protein